jgi:hypothetical protein
MKREKEKEREREREREREKLFVSVREMNKELYRYRKQTR